MYIYPLGDISLTAGAHIFIFWPLERKDDSQGRTLILSLRKKKGQKLSRKYWFYFWERERENTIPKNPVLITFLFAFDPWEVVGSSLWRIKDNAPWEKESWQELRNDFPITVNVNICSVFWQLWNWKCACFALSWNVAASSCLVEHPFRSRTSPNCSVMQIQGGKKLFKKKKVMVRTRQISFLQTSRVYSPFKCNCQAGIPLPLTHYLCIILPGYIWGRFSP